MLEPPRVEIVLAASSGHDQPIVYGDLEAVALADALLPAFAHHPRIRVRQRDMLAPLGLGLLDLLERSRHPLKHLGRMDSGLFGLRGCSLTAYPPEDVAHLLPFYRAI